MSSNSDVKLLYFHFIQLVEQSNDNIAQYHPNVLITINDSKGCLNVQGALDPKDNSV